MSKEFSDIHDDAITSIVFSRFDRNRILTASRDGIVKLFDIRMEKVLKKFEVSDIVIDG